MEIHFTPELDYHAAWFRAQVQKGLAQLERGEFIEHDDVVASIERILHS